MRNEERKMGKKVKSSMKLKKKEKKIGVWIKSIWKKKMEWRNSAKGLLEVAGMDASRMWIMMLQIWYLRRKLLLSRSMGKLGYAI
jgi:hypothetical protein